MEVKLTIIVLVVVTLLANLVTAEFFFNRPLPKGDEIDGVRYKCAPGTTTIKVGSNKNDASTEDSGSEEFTRKNHKTVSRTDESCQICVCAVDGLYEYCKERSVNNVNECLMLKEIQDQFQRGIPFEHTRNLAYRIRRDYIWHNDEIPYNTKAKCFRGHSYYTNSMTANDTDVDIGTDIESLLDYDNSMSCYFCICHTDGDKIACINRDTSVCEYYRYIRSDDNINRIFRSQTYDNRPMYFRQLSYQLRRTMDTGIYDMLDAVNNEDRFKRQCVPFISEYSDCSDDNLCSGCKKCKCNGDGQWDCEAIKKCPDDNKEPTEEEADAAAYTAIFDNALYMLESQMKERPPSERVKVLSNPRVPAPVQSKPQEDLLGPFRELNLEDFLASLSRPVRSTADNDNKHSKRSIDKQSKNIINSSHNNTVKFYNTIDELNEDNLKNSNLTGTVVAKKMDVKLPFSNSRRSYSSDNSSKALQIEHNHPKAYNQITDNKIEATEQDNHFDASHESLKTVFGNFTQTLQKSRNSDLSKIVVNELKTGEEVIGDAAAVPVSNITFTSENDTLDAMAFIAGNLLNKLWNMEKGEDASSTEIDALKRNKISDLLALFKEPLNIRQETFLKNALEQLSKAVDKDKDAKNISICDTIQEPGKFSHNASNTNNVEITTKLPCRKASNEKDTDIESEKDEMDVKQKEEKNENMASLKAIKKLNNVLDLIKKFETLQGKLNELKHGPKLDFNHSYLNNKKHRSGSELTKDEESSLNMFGSLLAKITNLILPQRNNKKIANVIMSQNFLKSNDNLKKKLKKMSNIDLTNMNVSAKDKIILDYLTHVDNNPDCLLNKKYSDVEATPSVEGNILQNLSKFYKLNSFEVLIKLLKPENKQESPKEITTQIVPTTTERIIQREIQSSIKGIDSHKFLSAKEKLKMHLKTIIEDLMELQSATGVTVKNNIKMDDVLPCIFNLLKADNVEIGKKEESGDPFERVAIVFQEMKKELKVSRRSFGDLVTERPKSAVVWERLINNLNEQSRPQTRRSLSKKKPKSYDNIKESMEKIEKSSSTYKQHALQVEVPAARKLILLKALQQDVQATINVIGDIAVSLESITKMPGATEKLAEIEEFVENRMTSLKVNEKVNEKVKSDPRRAFVSEINESNKMLKNKLKNKPIHRTSQISEDSDKMKISRVQIVSQLIRNRMQTFIKQKEANGVDAKQDLNYGIAQRVLYYLDTGNFKLANELFRWLVSQKQNDTASDKYDVTSTPKVIIEEPIRRMAGDQKKPPVLLEDPVKTKANHMTWAAQDQLIKQLLNIKNM